MNTIYCFWTDYNPMSEQRKRCLEQFRNVSECNVILVTPDILNDYILKEYPLHPAYQYLSQTHKADYLRTYFMNFIGGGYSDIKYTTGSWKKAFDDLSKADDKWMIGYKEINGGVAYPPLVNEYEVLIGNVAYICKPNTPLTNVWYNEMIKLLDNKLDSLKQNPAQHPRDHLGFNGSKYPLEWNEMLGRIFHRVSYEYREKLMNTLPISIFHSYL
jgi:hypothetical protein